MSRVVVYLTNRRNASLHSTFYGNGRDSNLQRPRLSYYGNKQIDRITFVRVFLMTSAFRVYKITNSSFLESKKGKQTLRSATVKRAAERAAICKFLRQYILNLILNICNNSVSLLFHFCDWRFRKNGITQRETTFELRYR